ncbi:TetR/AcrR family transcriptional regulator [Nocardia cyriacigeorgica]|jgi:AcrR family transcriptional regulator|uniref:TetR/AcrR family transcriptional regulator n=1 Tax=Nocardia cyriacigeorgica TaxID=135487 RepID=UPI000CEA3E68|nr:TetR/AcrR family transcriptional regulator [Nocardia cyriacigeorgica]AVH24370.1 TetR/AcrR family transcriptional regulator [Nocardia cyriacigeorgica]MBF6323673.1 TetR/AcrR family transcriptional regulator [Nocardia cyriacigeorgica]PPJ16025.1 TetR/AcrR family transcriptional regulator [Nocardia cyriacigeorgica]
MPNPPRRMRADAGRNRARVLEAATALFAERGDEVQMSEVAGAAGVGVGTIYRHFPTRQALMEAIAEQRFRQILDFARTKCPEFATGIEAVRWLLTHVGQVHEQGRTLSRTIESTLGSIAPQGSVEADLFEFASGILEQGKADGSLRPDVTADDLYMIIGSLASVVRADLGDWHRFVDIVLDGLKP